MKKKNVIVSCMIGGLICLAGGMPVFAGSSSAAYVANNKKEAMEDAYNSDTRYFRVEEDGTIVWLDYEGENEPRVLCPHLYESITISRHTKNSDGSCKTVYMEGQECSLCGRIVQGQTINTIRYDVCPH